MPSSGHFGDPLSIPVVKCIEECLAKAKKEGLDLEWWGTFLMGIKQGETPDNAAVGACNEWDI